MTPRGDPNEWECWVDEGHLWAIGHIANLNSIKGRKRRNPIGFAPAKKTRRVVTSGGRPAGTFPDVPRFDTCP